MLTYISIDGSYYEGDKVFALDTRCAPRPSLGHVFTGNVSLDPAICWRLKTSPEIDSDKNAEANSRINNDKFMHLLFEISFDQENRLRTLNAQPNINRAQYLNGLLTVYRGL